MYDMGILSIQVPTFQPLERLLLSKYLMYRTFDKHADVPYTELDWQC
jgi:hypothetical protein